MTASVADDTVAIPGRDGSPTAKVSPEIVDDNEQDEARAGLGLICMCRTDVGLSVH